MFGSVSYEKSMFSLWLLVDDVATAGVMLDLVARDLGLAWRLSRGVEPAGFQRAGSTRTRDKRDVTF